MGEGGEPLVFAFPNAQLGRRSQRWLLEAALSSQKRALVAWRLEAECASRGFSRQVSVRVNSPRLKDVTPGF